MDQKSIADRFPDEFLIGLLAHTMIAILRLQPDTDVQKERRNERKKGEKRHAAG